jgi:putative flippase GtrA
MRLPVQLTRFAAVGFVCTGAYSLLYLVLQPRLGPFRANAIALVVTAIANTAANRRFTFGTRGRSEAVRHHALGLAITSGSLEMLHSVSPKPHVVTELTVLAGANLTATAVRFALFKSWVFRPGRRTSSWRPMPLALQESDR